MNLKEKCASCPLVVAGRVFITWVCPITNTKLKTIDSGGYYPDTLRSKKCLKKKIKEFIMKVK